MARRPVPGDIVRIDYAEDRHTYGQVLTTPYVGIYDLQATGDMNIGEIIAAPVLFVVAVYDRVVSRGWSSVGKAPDGAPRIAIPEYFMQDMFQPASCQIIDAQGNARPATPQECAGLERAAVWDAVHVEERLRDHYAGRPNAYLESLKLRT
ncbi:MAG TPA: Imm26 family immunity protein [Candidatus Limnocylindrales bacterium]